MGYTPGENFVEIFWDKAERLSSWYIIQREIKKAISGQKYFVNDKETKKPEYFSPIDYSDFVYYYKLWENYHFFGYPWGLNWLEAPHWFNEFLKKMQNSYVVIQNMIEESNMPKTKT